MAGARARAYLKERANYDLESRCAARLPLCRCNCAYRQKNRERVFGRHKSHNEDVADGEIEPNVALRGEDGVAFMQAVMDAAYEYGLRPSKAVDSAAMEAHLNDMRDISRHLLKMNKQ